MVAQPEKMRMSVEEYLELDRSSSDVRYEYNDGYAYMMSGGTPQHALIIGNVQGELNRLFEQLGVRVLLIQRMQPSGLRKHVMSIPMLWQPVMNATWSL